VSAQTVIMGATWVLPSAFAIAFSYAWSVELTNAYGAVYLGVVVTVAGLFMWQTLLRVVPARVAASVRYLQPLVGIIAASVMFGDRIGPSSAVGVVLVIGGSVPTMTSHSEASNGSRR
jgi:drug/metabolite transporter (DMT)-like permease